MFVLAKLKDHFLLTWSILLTEVRFDLRLVRTWIFILGATLLGLSNAIQQYGVFSELSLFSSSVFMYTPLFIPMTIYPDFQVLTTLGLIFLAFDLASRDQRARLHEVIGTLPVSNAQIVFGRALGIVLIMAAALFAFSALHYAVTTLLAELVPTFGIQAPQSISVMSTWIVDAIPYLLFWTASVMLITTIVRNRVIVAAIMIGLMLGMYWLQNNATMDVLQFIGTYSLNTQLPSELAPVFTTESIVLQRVALTVLSCAFLLWAAFFYPRLNSPKTLNGIALAMMVTVASGLGFGLVYGQFNEQATQFQRWLQVHETHAGPSQIDLHSMHGTVDIQPNEVIVIDLMLYLSTLRAINPESHIVFTLNPGYEISELRLNDAVATFSFNDGLLLIHPNASYAKDESLVVSVEAVGNPLPNFAYLDARLNPQTSQGVASYGLILLGTSSFINHPAYVAMMPAVAWYPLPGAHVARNAISLRARDYFQTKLLVSIPPTWHLGGPGRSTNVNRENKRYVTLNPQQALHEIGLFAAPFERRILEVGDVELELLVGSHLAKQLHVLSPAVPLLTTQVVEIRERLDELGLEYPHKTYTIVHSPSYLRTYGGGWEMNATSSLPGVFLIREGTFFEANFAALGRDIALSAELMESEKQGQLAAAVLSYFNNDIMGGNILDGVCENVFSFRTNPHGGNAERLRMFLDYVVEQLVIGNSNFYSVYAIDEVSNLADAVRFTSRLANGRARQTLNEQNYSDWVNRPDIHERMLNQSESLNSFAHPGQRLHANELFARTMGDLLLAWYGRERTGELLAELVNRYDGEAFSYVELNQTAESLGMPLEQLFGDWLNQTDPAGFIAGTASTRRLPDTMEGLPLYEFSFPIRNDESTAGMVVLEYKLTNDQPESNLPWQSSEPIKVLGDTSVEVSIHTNIPIAEAQVQPFFSFNRHRFPIAYEIPSTIPFLQTTPKPIVQTSNWSWRYEDAILVDDLDAGFAVDAPPPPEQPRLEIQMIAFGVADPARKRFDQGLPIYEDSGNSTVREWTRQATASSFGKYRNTLVRVDANGSQQRVHFKSKLPKAGPWTLHYHLPQQERIRTQRVESIPNDAFRPRTLQAWADFDIEVVQDNKRFPVHFDGASMRAGWNALGTFDLQSGNTKVSVSSQAAEGVVVADAIFWQAQPN